MKLVNKTEKSPVASALETLIELADRIDAIEAEITPIRKAAHETMNGHRDMIGRFMDDYSARLEKETGHSPIEALALAKQRSGELAEMLAIEAERLTDEAKKLRLTRLTYLRNTLRVQLTEVFGDAVQQAVELTKAVRAERTYIEAHPLREWAAEIRGYATVTHSADTRNIARVVVRSFEDAVAAHSEVVAHIKAVS